MSDKKQTGHGVFGKGYYIALILCAAAIGVTGMLYWRSARSREDALIQATDPVGDAVSTEAGGSLAVIATQPQPQAQTLPPQQTQPPAVSDSLKTMSPVSGETVFRYAVDVLSYNTTTRDWRVHDGIDLAGEAGCEVVAAADGQVCTIYDDDSMGTTVVIRHQNGYTTKYSSLSEELSVSVGDTVTMGQVIGTVGTTALVETALGPHVHFSVTYQDKSMDPMEFLALS